MSLTTISALGWSFGLALVAGLLFALQRLRVRHREQVVLTTLFWNEAKEEARARSLVERFRHPLAYLLALLLAGLAWLGFGDPTWNDHSGTQYTVLLDGSQDMVHSQRFEEAKQEVLALTQDLPRQRTRVVLCGAGLETLLAPGEDRALLRQRLEGRLPSAAPNNLQRAAWLFAQAQPIGSAEANGAEEQQALLVVGSAPSFFSAAELGLPEGVALTYRSVAETEDQENAEAGPRLAAMGVTESVSDWGEVEVLLRVIESAGATQAPRVQLGELDWKGVVQRERVGTETHYRLAGVPADGSELRVSWDPSAAPAGRLRLPVRTPIRVHLDSSSVAQALQQALRADPAVELVEDPGVADLRVLTDSASSSEVPVLRLGTASEQPYAFFLVHEESKDSETVLMSALGDFGLDRIDANEWATQAGRAIELGAEPGAHRELHIWAELFDEQRFGWVESRAFPLLIGRAVRWLAAVDPVVPYLAAGEPIPQAISADGQAFASLSDWQPVAGGQFQNLAGERWSASALTRASSLRGFGLDNGAAAPSLMPQERGIGLLTWVLALAAALVLLEWALYSRGQIP